MKRRKRILGLLLAGVLAVGLIGCQKDGVNTSPVTESVIQSDDTAEITVLMMENASADPDNMVLKALEEKTGTNINMITATAADYAAKLSNLIAASETPDIFWVGSLKDAQDYINSGLVANVEELLVKLAPNVMEETGDLLHEVAVNEEGVYLVPSGARPYGINLNMRADWLENLGLEMPTDLESYKKVLHAFTYDDPDGNGADDTYGLEFTLEQVGVQAWINVFGAFDIPAGKEILLEDGTVTTWVKHPRFLEAMAYIREIVDDGVCEPDFISIPAMSAFEKLWTGVAGCLEFQCVGPTNNWMPGRYTEDPVPEFCFPKIEGPDGKSGVPASYPTLSSGYMFSADCANLEGAIRIADFCMSKEGDELLYLGIEDEMYRWVDEDEGKYEYLGEYTDSTVHRAAGGFCYWGLFMRTDNIEFRSLNAQTREGVQKAWENAIEWPYIPYPSEVKAEYGADLDQAIKEMLAELFTTKEPLQTVYDKWISEWETLGGSEWEEELTALWEE